MTRVAIAGFGVMGRTHLGAYLADPRAEVTALADSDLARIESGGAAGNFKGLGGGAIDLEYVRRHERFEDLLAAADVDAISICTPTATHVDLAIAAIRAGKHVLIEKPLGLSAAEGQRVVDESAKHPGVIAMPAMCMRFWPAWTWVRSAILEKTYGEVMTATFRRLGSMPTWSPFYKDSALSGGAILDLHIHDADFVRFCFGDPVSVHAWGHSETTAGVDHVIAMYEFDTGPPIVAAEGGWSMKPGFEFTMQFTVNFRDATARFNFQSSPQLTLHGADGNAIPVEIPAGEGYAHEIAYFLDCIEHGRSPETVTLSDGAEAVRLIEAERLSVYEKRSVPFRRELVRR